MIPERIKGLLEQAEVWIAAFKKETYEESFQKVLVNICVGIAL